MAKSPNAFLVAKAWLLGVTGIPAGKVARELPEDTSTWFETGFISIPGTVGGGSQTEVPLRQPVLDVRFWSQPRKTSSQKVSWNRASELAEFAYDGSYDPALSVQRVLTIGTGFDDARVLTVLCPSEPQELPQQDSDFACFTMPMQFNWYRIPE